MEMTVPDISVGARGPLCVTMAVALCTQPNVERLKEILRTHPGTTDVQVRLESAGQSTLLKIEEGLRVRVTPSLSADLKALFGAGCLV